MSDGKLQAQYKDVDGWIEKLMGCNHLTEAEVKQLVVKVSRHARARGMPSAH